SAGASRSVRSSSAGWRAPQRSRGERRRSTTLTAPRRHGYADPTATGRSHDRSREEPTPMMLRSATLLISTLLVLPVLAPAFATSKMDAEMEALRRYCRPDVDRLCPNVQPGGGRIKACLMQHKDEVSVGCAKALQSMKKSH